MTTVEKYSNSRFGHIERKRDAFNEVVIVFDDVKGEVFSKHSTMEGAKNCLAELNREHANRLPLAERQRKRLELLDRLATEKARRYARREGRTLLGDIRTKKDNE